MSRSLRVCPVPGCPTLTEGGRCDDHQRAADRARGTAAERGYTSGGHQAFRRAVLARDPVCVVCRAARSTVADHHPRSRKELVDAGENPNDPRFGRGLCKADHDRATAQHQPGGWHQPTA